MTLRLRLMIYYSGLLILILALFGTAVFMMLNWTLQAQVDNTLSRVLADVLQETGGALEVTAEGQPRLTAYVPRLDTFRTPGVYVQIWEVYNATPRLFSTSENLGAFTQPLDRRALGAAQEIRSEVTINGTHLRVITHPITIQGQQVGNVQAAASLTVVEAATDRLMKIMLGGGVIALLLSLLIGDYLARRTLRPIEAIVSTAQSITAADDLGRRIPDGGVQDELGRMIRVFNQTLARLERSFHAQRRFVGDVSHELRTPLTTIQGNLDLIRLYGNDPKSLSAIEAEVKRMGRMVDDLLLLAQADAGQLPMRMDVLSLDQLLLETYNEVGVLAKDKQLLLGEFEPALVAGNADRLKQLFLNLLTNALKYTPEGGKITLSLRQQEGAVYASVSDTGIGIPSEDLPLIFDRFYRVDKARSRGAGGTGLGLSIAKWIAETHHAEIKVASTLGEGTTFTVIFPLAKPASDAQPAPESEPRLRRPLLKLSSQ